MEVIEKVSLTHFIWYLLPGLALLLLLLFPLAFINLDFVVKFYETLGAFGIVVLAIVMGFVIEGLRLYRFRPKYNKIKKDFFSNLGSTLESDLNSYYLLSRVKDVAQTKNIVTFELRHSIWIMLGQLTILFFGELLFWLVYLACAYWLNIIDTYKVFSLSLSHFSTIAVLIALITINALITIRLYQVSIDEQKTTNDMILSFAKQNARSIKELL